MSLPGAARRSFPALRRGRNPAPDISVASHRSGICCDALPGPARYVLSHRYASRLHRENGDADHMTFSTGLQIIPLHLGTTLQCNLILCNLGQHDAQHVLRATRRLRYFLFRVCSRTLGRQTRIRSEKGGGRRPPQNHVHMSCFHTTRAARGRVPCAASCGSEKHRALCVPCLRACYLRPPLICSILCIRETLGLRNIQRRKPTLEAAALYRHRNVISHSSIQCKKTWTTWHVEPVRSLLLRPHLPASRQHVNAKKQKDEEGGLAWAGVGGPARATFSPPSE